MKQVALLENHPDFTMFSRERRISIPVVPISIWHQDLITYQLCVVRITDRNLPLSVRALHQDKRTVFMLAQSVCLNR